MDLHFRPGTEQDSHLVFQIFLRTMQALSERMGTEAISGGTDPQLQETLWERRESLFIHLADTAKEFWIGEVDGRPAGYARSIQRGKLLELTEFFVLPEYQGHGLGGELLQLSYPLKPDELGVIVATIDPAALARYLKSGHVPRFPAVYFQRNPRSRKVNSDLTFREIKNREIDLEIIDNLDCQILGHSRIIDHQWLMRDRQGYLYLRSGIAVGYGYVGASSGPFALADPIDYPVVLAHAENFAYESGFPIGFEVPLINTAAVQYLLEQGYRMDGFLTLFLSTQVFGDFHRYIYTGPPFFI